MGKLKILFPLVILIIALIPVSASDIQRCAMCHSKIAQNFTKSLHYTNLGMIEKWNQGAGKDFNMPFPEFCMKCHIENCSTCHPVHKAFPNMTTCIDCHHKRIGVNYIGYLAGMTEKGPYPDVHYQHNLTCLDCHSIEEIHGDGNNYTMAYSAVKVRCEDCHMNESAVIKGMKPKQFDPTILPHKLHKDIVSCYACHAGWYQTCVNCHFEQKKPEKTTINEFHLVKGPDGKLYPACSMFVFYGDKASYAWCLIHPHTITKEGRKCEDCHTNTKEVFCVGAPGRVIGPPNSGFANPPDKLVVKVPILNIWIDTGMLGTLIIGATLAGICLHYLKRRITMGGE